MHHFSTLLIAAFSVGIVQLQAQVPMTPEQIMEKASPSVALVLAGRADGETLMGVGAAVVVRENGILLTAYHVVKNAESLQVRFKSGEVFDSVQLLGADVRRDIAALRISATALPVLPIARAELAKVGESVGLIAHAGALPWSASTGIIAAFRLADDVPGAGNGFRLIQFTAPASPGSSGGLLIDSKGAALGIITGSLANGQNLNFAVPIESVLGLSDGVPAKAFTNGSGLNMPNAPNRINITASRSLPPIPSTEAPEKSDRLKTAKESDTILRTFKTMYIEARPARHFGNEQLKAALIQNKSFAALNIKIVDDLRVADVILNVAYTAPWDFPFELKYQNTATVLFAGKGSGPFSGPAGATSVAKEFVKLALPFRPKLETKK